MEIAVIHGLQHTALVILLQAVTHLATVPLGDTDLEINLVLCPVVRRLVTGQ